MVSFIKIYWKTILITCIVFSLSVLDFSKVDSAPKLKYGDKIIHILMYCVLTCFLCIDTMNEQKWKKNSYILICFLYPIVFGGIIEIIQELYFPPRTAEWFDWVADIVGVVIGFTLFKVISPYISKPIR